MTKQFNKNLLSIAVCSALAYSNTAIAYQEESQENKAEDKSVEVIEVLGIRKSIASAQDLKRMADTVKDVITATDIGSLPDKSVTEALQRVPGVTIERFAASDDPKHYADEGTGVLVRGLDRVRSEINGRDAFSANPSGGLSYEDFPAELLGAVEVVKNQTADLISGGIAGTVNLITRKPFDSPDRMFAFGVKGNYGDYRKEATPSFNALFSDNWETNSGKWGLLVAGSRTEFKTKGDGFGLGNYHSRGPFSAFSYESWGELRGPGVEAGFWDGPCSPSVQAWDGTCEPSNLYTEEDEENYVSEYEGGPVEGQPDGVTYYTPAALTITTAENERKRTGLTASVQWESPDERTLVTVEHIYSKASLDWREYVINNGERGFISTVPDGIKWSAGSNRYPLTVDKNGYVTSGVGDLTTTQYHHNFFSRYNNTESEIADSSINIRFKATDSLTVHFDYQNVDSERTVDNYQLTASMRGGDYTDQYAPFFLDLRNETPSVEFLNPGISNPPDVPGPTLNDEGDLEFTHPVLSLYSGLPHIEANDAESDSFKLDLEYVIEKGVFTRIHAGAYYSDKDLVARSTEYEGWQPLNKRWVAEEAYLSSTQVAPELFERVNFRDHFRGDTFEGPFTSFLFPRMNLTENFNQTLREGCGTYFSPDNAWDQSGNCALPYDDMTGRVDGPFAARHISETNTKRTEFYLRADFEVDLSDDVYLTGNIGLRSVDYDLESTGAVTLPAPASVSEVGSVRHQVWQDLYPELVSLSTGEAFFSTVDHNYSTVLPSLNLNFGIGDDFVVRFGASKGIFFPSLTDSVNKMFVSLSAESVLQDPNQAENDETNPVIDYKNIEITANARNPYLDPEESVNLDVTAEWYFAETGSLTAGLFRKKLDGIIRNKSFASTVEANEQDYTVSAYGPSNVGSGTIQGYEVSYTQFYDMLPGALKGLGLQLNYTYIDQDGLEDPNENPTVQSRFSNGSLEAPDGRNTFRQFSGLPLVGYSDQNVNIVGMYEYEGISARLAYTWRSEYLLALRESTEFVPVYSEAQGLMDFSIHYNISDNFKVGFEVSNVLGENTNTKYQQNQEGTLTDAFTFTTDRRYALSLRGSF
ncbi:TonB-dependent receptor [Thalassotalea sediminis]|uniref:TonB-dependent receptor n=1 Tax=Thalassotalea sediminis TaxID=1759089 RepID=UPI0025733C04|nr:TonB-dependent receptor [Thalassotalea sediminis]